MTTLHDIYSRVANDINDLVYGLIGKGEYLAMAKQVALYLSRYVDLFVREVEYKATDDVQSFVVPIALSSVQNLATPTGYIADFPDPHYRVNRLLKVVRNNQDCREVSWQAVESASRGNNAFKTNDSQLDYRFYAVRVLPTGDLELHWVQPIAKDETVLLFTLCDLLPEPNWSPSTLPGSASTPKWSEFRDFTPIPDLLISTFYTHMLVETFTILLNRKGEEYASRLMVAKDRAKRELYELRRYITNLKSKSSMGQIQPFKWLSEDESYTTTSGSPNIPADWTSTVIL